MLAAAALPSLCAMGLHASISPSAETDNSRASRHSH
jgi:hypothetical protein